MKTTILELFTRLIMYIIYIILVVILLKVLNINGILNFVFLITLCGWFLYKDYEIKIADYCLDLLGLNGDANE